MSARLMRRSTSSCSLLTREWLAWLVYPKVWLLTPLDRVRRNLAERGIDGLHGKQLLATPWMATARTGLKVLVSGLSVAHDGYVELYRNRRGRGLPVAQTTFCSYFGSNQEKPASPRM